MVELEKMKGGLIAIAMLIIMQGFAWFLNKDGAVTATIFGLLGLIAGAIFGFVFQKIKVEP
jgi:hypothetical protein